MKKSLLSILLFPSLAFAAVPAEVTAQTSSLVTDVALVGTLVLVIFVGDKVYRLMRGAFDSDYSFYSQIESKVKEETSLAAEARENEQEALEVADYWADEAEVHEERIDAYGSLLSTR